MRVDDYAAERGLSPELAEQWREVDEVVDSLPLRLARRDDSPEIRAVRDAFAAYDAAVDRQYDLLASRSLAEAEELDERRVDPAFEQLLAARVQQACSSARNAPSRAGGRVGIDMTAQPHRTEHRQAS